MVSGKHSRTLLPLSPFQMGKRILSYCEPSRTVPRLGGSPPPERYAPPHDLTIWIRHAGCFRTPTPQYALPLPRLWPKPAIPSALPALASFIAQAPADLAAQAEDFLTQLAGEAGPKDLPQGEASREKRSAAWGAWAQTAKNNPAVFGTTSITTRERVGPASGKTMLGYTLLVQPQSNTVTALGPDGKERWALTGLQGPSDAQVLSNQHILVAESDRVTERDLRGTVLWKLEGIAPVSVQRLPNGNTFIPCNNQLIEVDRRGKEVFRSMIAGIAAARRLPDGRIVAFDRNEIIQLDKGGNEVKRVSR